MSQQNRSAQRRPAHAVPDSKQQLQVNDTQQRIESGLNDLPGSRLQTEQSPQSKVDLIDKYTQLLDDLNAEYADTTRAYTNLEIEIMDRETDCGRLMRQYLEIGEQIRQQKETISTRRAELKRTQTKREQTSKQKDAVMRKIATLAGSSGQ